MNDGAMRGERIVKSVAALAVSPNLVDYASFRARFSWDARAPRARRASRRPRTQHRPRGGRPPRGRSAREPSRAALAGQGRQRPRLHVRRPRAPDQPLRQRAPGLGVRPGDRVFVLTGRIPELYVAALGTLESRAVFCPLFSAFGPEPLRARLAIGEAKVLVTTPTLYRKKVAGLRASLPHLTHVLLVGATAPVDGTLDFGALLDGASDAFDDPADRSRGHGAAAFHQRHHRHAEGRGARARGRRRAPRDRQARARPAPGRHLLVHRRSGLGDRHVVRHHRAADERRHQHRRRGRLRRRALVRHPRRTQKVTRLVHGADGDPHDDEGGPRPGARASTCPRCASSRASASRSTRRRSSGASRRSGCRSTTTGGRPRPAAS